VNVHKSVCQESWYGFRRARTASPCLLEQNSTNTVQLQISKLSMVEGGIAWLLKEAAWMAS
jgi:hypothetical protein